MTDTWRPDDDDVARIRRAREVFDAVIDLPPAEQGPALEAACGGDEALRAMVAELIGLDDAPSVLDTMPELGVISAMAEAIGQDLAPARLGRFAIIRELGRGGMGVVYEAEQSLPQRRVALKTLPPWNRSASAHELFRNEVQALALVLHPGIPQIYEVFEHHGTPVMAMELVEGPGLIEAAAAMDIRQRVRLLVRIVQAAQHAHDRGIIHRDLKPQNILVDAAGQPKVLDFGIAALVGEGSRSSGTLAYMPPEQFAGGGSDVRSDVYSLGATGWELFLGAPPLSFDALDTESVQQVKQTAELSAPELPRPLAAVLIKALAPAPEDRYPTAAAFAADLERYRSDWPVEALAGVPEAWAAAHARRLWRRGLLVAGAMVVAAGVVMGGLELRERRAQIAVEARAGAELSAIQDSARRAGADDPTVTVAFDAFTSAPENDGTAALSEGWLWWGQRAGAEAARRDLAAAWLTAPDDATEQAALTALAPLLAAEERWGAVAAVLKRLPDDALTDLRFQEAVIRRRFDEAAAYSHDAAPLLQLFRSARQDAGFSGSGRILPDGDRLLFQETEMVRVAGDGEVRWTIPVEGSTHPAAIYGDRIWFFQGEGSTRTVMTKALDSAEPPALVERLTTRARDMVVADMDGDSIPERYLLEYRPNQIRRAEPASSPSEPIALIAAGAQAVPHDLHLVEPEGLAPALLVANSGWGDHDMRALTATDGGLQFASRYRMFANNIKTLRGPDGQPEVIAIANAVGSRPQEQTPYPDVLVRASWDGERLRPVGEPLALEDYVRTVEVADLDGDGLEDLIFMSAESSGTLLLRQLPDGGFASVFLDKLRFVAAGELGPRPGAELWLEDGEQSWVFGVEGGAPIPPLPADVVLTPQAVPEGILGPLRQRWERAEALASLGLAPDAAALLATMGDRPGAVGAAALTRAIALVPETSEAAEYARVLLAREGEALTEAQRSLALATLWEVYDIDSLRQLGAADLPASLSEVTEVHGAGPLHPAWQVLDPSVVRYDLNSGELEVSVVNGRGPALALPLDWDGEAIDVQLDIDLLEHDWGNQLQIAVETRDGDGELWSAGVVLSRGGGGAPETHTYGVRCSVLEDPGSAIQEPVSLGERTLRMTWVPGRGDMRCSMDGRGLTSPIPHSPGGQVRLVVGDGLMENIPGLVRFRLKRLHIAGATPREAPGYEVNTAFIQGDLAAATTLRARGTPLQKALASAPFQTPGPQLFQGMPAEDAALLLRADPLRWTAPAQAALGTSFAEVWRTIWAVPVSYRMPEARAAVMLPVMADLPLEDEGAHSLILWRAEELMNAGQTLEANALLGLMLATSSEHTWRAWLLIARLRHMRGDTAGAREALTTWLAQAPEPERALDLLYADERLRELAPPERPPAPALTLDDVREAYESSR